MKMIFVVNTPFAIRDYKRFGAEYFYEKGYHVECWRVMGEDVIKMEWSAGMYRSPNYFEYSEVDYKKRLMEYSKDSLFVFQGESEEMYSAAKCGCRYILMTGFGAIPSPSDAALYRSSEATSLIYNRIKDIMSSGFLKRAIRFFSKRIGKQVKRYSYKKNPPQVIATSTCFAKDTYVKPVNKRQNILCIHAMDYDRFIEANQVSGSNKHIVYIDSGFFSKSYDNIRLSRKMPYEYRKEYLSQLRYMFDRLESIYNVPVVIAGHPHLYYGDSDFAGRSIVFNRTCELVRDSLVAIITSSTAMNFIALYDTPTLKIANSRLAVTNYDGYNAYEYIREEAEEIFGCGFLNLSDKEAMEHPEDYIKKMDPVKRRDYIEKYIIDNDTTDDVIAYYLEKYIIEHLANTQL